MDPDISRFQFITTTTKKEQNNTPFVARELLTCDLVLATFAWMGGSKVEPSNRIIPKTLKREPKENQKD